jgi:hypothetical protein
MRTLHKSGCKNGAASLFALMLANRRPRLAEPLHIQRLQEIHMRKLIMMAIAGFVWRKLQARVFKQVVPARSPRRSLR